MAFIGFFFSWMWIYVPALPSIKNNKPLYYSALVGFIFFIICDPIFIYSFQSSFELNINNPQALLALQLKAATGTGIIYLVYFIIQPFYVYFYLKFYKYLRKMTLVVLQPFMKLFYLKKPDQYQTYLDNLKNVFNQNYLESQVLFFNKFRVSLYYWRIILLLSWGNLLDQSFYNLIAVLHFVYSTNFGGQFPNGPGFEHISVLEGWNQTVSNFAANHYFKLIMANPEMLLIFFFGIWDSFSVLPSYFVARELGIGNKKQAKTNMWRCMHWSYLMGASFTIIIIIFALFINQYATYPAQSGMFNYDIDYNGHVVATVKYYQLWDDARNAMIIWAFMLFFFTATDMGFYVILSGASKILIVGDALITAIFVGVAMALYYTHFNNMLGFYFIPHLDKIVKYFIYITFIFTSQSSNSINDVMKVKNEVKQPVEELEPSPMSPN